jgi:hypothetical protein
MHLMQNIPLIDEFFHGHVSLQRRDGGIMPWRLPVDRLALFPSDNDNRLHAKASESTGVRLELQTDATELELRSAPHGAARRFDATVGGAMVAQAELPAGETAVRLGPLPAGEKMVELWLAKDQPTVVTGLLVNDGASARPASDGRKRWIAYGSSITQCRAAHSPARTWPATAARAAGLHLTCLGYGGECHLDSMLARMIRDMPADLITLKLGINTHGGTFSHRTFKPAAIGMVQIIREKHPATPLAVIGPIISPPREDARATASSMTLQEMRESLADAVARLRSCGDGRIIYFDGRDLFGRELAATNLPDQLHPDGDGYEIMGRNAAALLLPRLLSM